MKISLFTAKKISLFMVSLHKSRVSVFKNSASICIGGGYGILKSLVRVRCINYDLLGVSSEKAMATHFSTLAWKIPWMEEPGRLQSMGVAMSQTRLSDFTFTFNFHAFDREMATHSSVLSGESQGQGSLVGCHLWDHTESNTTETT